MVTLRVPSETSPVAFWNPQSSRLLSSSKSSRKISPAAGRTVTSKDTDAESPPGSVAVTVPVAIPSARVLTRSRLPATASVATLGSDDSAE